MKHFEKRKYEDIAWQQILLNKLKRKKLEISLVDLARREKEEWIPFYYSTAKDGRDINGIERNAIAEWQGTVAIGFRWGVETRFDAVALFDDVMRKVRVSDRLQFVVAAATLCIAAKMNEEEENMSSATQILETLKVDLAPKDLCRMEIVLLRKLQWHPKRCLALAMLQTMMALVVVRVSYFVGTKDISYEFVNLFLEMQMRWLFILMIQSKCAEIRPSVLAMTLVYFHLDWDKRPHLKEEIMPSLQSILMVSDYELEIGLRFAYPLVGIHFYHGPPSNSIPVFQNRSKWTSKSASVKLTTYDNLQRERICTTKTYPYLSYAMQLNSSSTNPPAFAAYPETAQPRRRKTKKKSTLRIPPPRYIVSRSRRALKRAKRKNLHRQLKRNLESNKENKMLCETKEIEA